MKKKFDPNSAATKDSGIFGLPFSINDAKLVLLPVPWEATTSYGGGTSKGPEAIFHASKQVDLYDGEMGNFYEAGIAMLPISKQILKWNQEAKAAAKPIIKAGGDIGNNTKLKSALQKVNALSVKVNDYVYEETKKYLDKGKIVGLIGGDHASPLGAIKAYLEKYPDMGVLHFDAHIDMRVAYEGFKYSHASIMYNLLEETEVKKLIQVGIRDFCEEEINVIRKHGDRVQTFFDQDIAELKLEGETWSEICDDIIANLPDEVYISFDIDGFDPVLCPNTGTPVPGGLSFQEALFIFKKILTAGKKIVGFDLNEVAPGPKGDEWNANVGARLLYKLCGRTLTSSS
ncbi:MAG: agmatinase family protein [Oligoflexia bacterium]|nr:agmatinase family protein [Oligoflexia bacterium]